LTQYKAQRCLPAPALNRERRLLSSTPTNCSCCLVSQPVAHPVLIESGVAEGDIGAHSLDCGARKRQAKKVAGKQSRTTWGARLEPVMQQQVVHADQQGTAQQQSQRKQQAQCPPCQQSSVPATSGSAGTACTAHRAPSPAPPMLSAKFTPMLQLEKRTLPAPTTLTAGRQAGGAAREVVARVRGRLACSMWWTGCWVC
jgi:hypothetical protein